MPQQFVVNKADLIELKRETLATLSDDLTRLEELNVPLILHNLKERAKNRQIYTNVGTILISINPYEMLPVRSRLCLVPCVLFVCSSVFPNSSDLYSRNHGRL